MAEVHVCIPVLRRYDLFRRLLASLSDSTVQPTCIHILNNGRRWADLAKAMEGLIAEEFCNVAHHVRPMGVAASWNWFIRMTPEERIIVNDDIAFAPESLEKMVTATGDIVFAHGFSCFLIRDRCVRRIGYFDEDISPGYAYYEDEDYAQRMRLAAKTPEAVIATNVEAGVVHGGDGEGSSTYRAGTVQEIAEHWQRHDLAHRNFVRKWGAEPDVLKARA